MPPVSLFEEKEGFTCTARDIPGINSGKGFTPNHISLACWIIVRHPVSILVGGWGGENKTTTVGVLSV